MNLKQLFILGLLLLSGICNAQTNFKPGYVIKANGDSLVGEIDYRGDLSMCEVCKFRMNDTEKEIKYSPEEIIAYRFKDDKYFISKELMGKKVFLEFLIKGKVSIYYMRDNLGDHYFLDKEGIGISELKYKEEIKYIDGTQYDLESKSHQGMLNYYMQDVPDFQSRIADVAKPEHLSLIKLAEEYHHKVCKDESCIIYEKKIPFLKYNLEFVGGSINYSKSSEIVFSNSFQGGILGHLWMPRTNEKMYFRTGIIFSKPVTTYGTKSNFKIPLQIEYIYPKGIFVPKIAFGFNLYQPFYLYYSFMAGVNIMVNKKVGIGVSYDVDFVNDDKMNMIPKYIYSQGFLAGLYIKF